MKQKMKMKREDGDDKDVMLMQSPIDRRIIRSHYHILKMSIAEEKDGIVMRDSESFKEMMERVESLHSLVNAPREQISDAESLLDITNSLLSSVKRSQRGNGVTPAELVNGILQNFQPKFDSTSHDVIDWQEIGHKACSIFSNAPGMSTMLCLVNGESKKRRMVKRKREQSQSSQVSCPETLENNASAEEGKTETDKIIRVMFNILRRQRDEGAPLDHLVLNRDSFSQTIENIFSLSFLVKDGRVGIFINDMGKHIAVIRNSPTAAERGGSSSVGQVSNAQFVFRLDYQDWKVMKEEVEDGQELMPNRPVSHSFAQAQAPVRVVSRNRARETALGLLASSIGDTMEDAAKRERPDLFLF